MVRLRIVEQFSLLSADIRIARPFACQLLYKANTANEVEYPEYTYNPALCPPCSQRVFQPEHNPYLFGQFSAQNPCIHTGCHIASTGDDVFLELNNHFELPYQQTAEDEPHITGAFNLSTASESLKRAKSADQALLPGNHLTLFSDDTNIDFSVFGNSSSQIALPWPEVNLLLQNPGTANDILAGLPCSHISRQLLSRWQ